MTIRDVQGQVMDQIPVRNVLISVYDKSGLGTIVPTLLEVNPDVRILSTGGTYDRLKSIAGANLVEVAEYTGFPEMEGGLVKTLHPKIHAGLLGERGNPAHEKYLAEMGGEYIDLLVVNLYPFSQVVAQGVSFEKARGNIDIGGPAMLRAGAKNFLSCAVVCDPADYGMVIAQLKQQNGNTVLPIRASLATKAFGTTARYDAAVASYMLTQMQENLDGITESYRGG